jgi:hypothetical protein
VSILLIDTHHVQSVSILVALNKGARVALDQRAENTLAADGRLRGEAEY